MHVSERENYTLIKTGSNTSPRHSLFTFTPVLANPYLLLLNLDLSNSMYYPSTIFLWFTFLITISYLIFDVYYNSNVNHFVIF